MKENILKDTYKKIDESIEPNRFNVDWEHARYVVNQRVDNKTRSGKFFRVKNTMIPASALSVLMVVVASIFIFGLQKENAGLGSMGDEDVTPQNPQVIVPIDPNQPWYAPTDELLQLSVLSYQSQWITYTQYDPITMEIR